MAWMIPSAAPSLLVFGEDNGIVAGGVGGPVTATTSHRESTTESFAAAPGAADDDDDEMRSYLRARILAVSRSNSGALLQSSGRRDEAMEEYRAAVGVRMEALRRARARAAAASSNPNLNPNPALLVEEEENSIDETAPTTSPKEKAKKKKERADAVQDDKAQTAQTETETYQEALRREDALLADCFGPTSSSVDAAAARRDKGEGPLMTFQCANVDLYRRDAYETAMDEPPAPCCPRSKLFADLTVSSPLLLDRSSVFDDGSGFGSTSSDGNGNGNDCIESAATLLNMGLLHADRASDAAAVEIYRSESEKAVRLLNMALSILPDFDDEGAASFSGAGGLLSSRDSMMRVAAERCVSDGSYHSYVVSWQQQQQDLAHRDRFVQSFSSASRAHEGAPQVSQGQDEEDEALPLLPDKNSQTLPPVYWTLVSAVHSALGKLHLSADPLSAGALSHLARAWIAACLSALRLPADASRPLVLSALSDLGHAHYRRGEMSHAASACQASLHLLRHLLFGETNASACWNRRMAEHLASRTLHNLATVHYACGQLGPALGRYSAFLELHRDRDDDLLLRANTLHRMGRIHLSAGDPHGAVGPLRDAAELMTSRQLVRSSSPDVSGRASMMMAATTTEGNEEQDKATTRGDHHPSLIPILDNLGTAYLESNLPHEALRAFRRALIVVKRASGPRSADAAAQLCNIGHVYFLLGYYDETVKCFREALDIVEDLTPDEEMDDEDDDDNDETAVRDDASRIEEGGLRPEEALAFQIHLLNHLGAAQLESGDPVAALAAFEEASELEQRAVSMSMSSSPLLPSASTSAAAAGPYNYAHQRWMHPVVTPDVVAQTRRGAAMARARLPLAANLDVLALMGLNAGAGAGDMDSFHHAAPAA